MVMQVQFQITVGRDGHISGVTEVAIEVARAQTLNANYIGTITGTPRTDNCY